MPLAPGGDQLANPVLTRAFQDTDSIVTTDERMTIGGVGRSSMVLLAIEEGLIPWWYGEASGDVPSTSLRRFFLPSRFSQ